MELAQLAERVAQPGGAAPFVRAAAIQLVGWPSVTGTSAEAEFGERLQMLIRSLPYFRTHPEAVWLEPVPDDPLGRSNVFALVRGGGASGVVLMGHYDVVSTEPYGGLQDLAFRPEELRTALVEELSRSARSAADQLALNDLADAAFLPGRGMLDMKSGLAAGLAVLLRCAEAGEGTVLFIASPDEEALSAGARAAVSGLGRVAERTGIEFVAAVNLDSEVDPGDGSRGRAVFLGSVGKLLPAALLVGRPAHSGAPFAGVNAAYLGAALAVDLELSPIWSRPGEAGIAPPVCLSLRDLKSGYDVTLPSMSFVAFNVMFHERAPAEVFQAFVEQVGIVLRRALRTLADRASAAGAQVSWSEPAVLTLAELPGGGEPGPVVSPDPLLGSWEAAVSAVRRAGVDGPAAVALLAGPYYPSVSLGHDPRSARLLEIAALHAERLGAERGAPISLRDCFPGISDMSFLGSGRAGAVHEVVDANTPDAGRFSWDGLLSARLELPMVNIGPWGRDYHERLERVHEGYSFDTLPELVYSVVRDLLKED